MTIFHRKKIRDLEETGHDMAKKPAGLEESAIIIFWLRRGNACEEQQENPVAAHDSHHGHPEDHHDDVFFGFPANHITQFQHARLAVWMSVTHEGQQSLSRLEDVKIHISMCQIFGMIFPLLKVQIDPNVSNLWHDIPTVKCTNRSRSGQRTEVTGQGLIKTKSGGHNKLFEGTRSKWEPHGLKRQKTS